MKGSGAAPLPTPIAKRVLWFVHRSPSSVDLFGIMRERKLSYNEEEGELYASRLGFTMGSQKVLTINEIIPRLVPRGDFQANH